MGASSVLPLLGHCGGWLPATRGSPCIALIYVCDCAVSRNCHCPPLVGAVEVTTGSGAGQYLMRAQSLRGPGQCLCLVVKEKGRWCQQSPPLVAVTVLALRKGPTLLRAPWRTQSSQREWETPLGSSRSAQVTLGVSGWAVPLHVLIEVYWFYILGLWAYFWSCLGAQGGWPHVGKGVVMGGLFCYIPWRGACFDLFFTFLPFHKPSCFV
jgi:hypothetical protein